MTQVLAGIRVLDFSRVFAAPDSTQILGDLGADVIKVEHPEGGDDCRQLGVTREQLEELGGSSPSFRSFNRNKRSIAIDLARSEGREIARKLALSSDIVVNNFRPGTMEKWNLGYDDLRPNHPALIFCDFHAYGSSGPLAHIGANDLALQAHSGLMSITGEENGGPVRAGSAVIDLHASLAIVSGILAALLHRERTGMGQKVETSLLSSSAHLMSYFYQDYWLTGNLHRRLGTANHLSVPNQAFPTTDGYVIIIAPSDEMWKRCAQALAPDILDRPEWATSSERLARRHDVVEAITSVARSLSKAEIHDRLSRARVNVSIVQEIGEAADHLQLAAIGSLMDGHGANGPARYVGPPFQLSDTPAAFDRPPPGLGEHTDEIMGEAGYGSDETERFHRQGVIGGR